MDGIEVAIDTMRFSQEPCIQKFLATYDSIPQADRDTLPFEAIVLKSQVNVNELLGATAITYQILQSNKSALAAMRAHPEIVERTIYWGKQEKGAEDRRMLHQATRFLPTPKGQTFNFNLPNAGAPEAPTKHESINVDEEPDINECFPLITNDQNEWQTQKALMLKDKN